MRAVCRSPACLFVHNPIWVDPAADGGQCSAQARYGWSAASAPGPRQTAAAERVAAAALRERAARISPAAAYGVAAAGDWEAGVRARPASLQQE
jgi:hypothetical protein